MPVLVPPIKCQGIKTKLVPAILANVSRDLDGRWIEPFVGSAVVALNVRPARALLCDSNPHLIRFYRAVQEGHIDGAAARKFLEREGRELARGGERHYRRVRDRFNADGRPLDFLFLNRSCFNGLIRFNRSGGFNVPFGHKPNRFAAAYVTKIANQIDLFAGMARALDWRFACQDYRDTIRMAAENDFVYCDPPYVGRHVDYYDSWDEDSERALREALTESGARFMLSTWHSNQHRANAHLRTLWRGFPVTTRRHFYHVGAREKNRKPMLEALVTSYRPVAAPSAECAPPAAS